MDAAARWLRSFLWRCSCELEVSMPVAAATEQIVQGLVGIAGDDVDFASLIELVARGSGLDLTAEDVEVDDGLSPLASPGNGAVPASPRPLGSSPAGD